MSDLSTKYNANNHSQKTIQPLKKTNTGTSTCIRYQKIFNKYINKHSKNQNAKLYQLKIIIQKIAQNSQTNPDADCVNKTVPKPDRYTKYVPYGAVSK